MEIAPNNLEVCLKLNRFVCNEAENDVVACSESRVRILSSHELSTVTTVALPGGHPVTVPVFKQAKHTMLPNSNQSVASAGVSDNKDKYFDETNPNAVFIDSTVEEFPKRKPAKFLQMLNQERKSRWAADQAAFPVDGTDPASREHSSRISKGMHPPPRLDEAALNPIRTSDLLAKQIRDEMFLDILAQQRSQNLGDNMSQISELSAKERILKTGHATGLPDYLRQL